MHQTKKGNEWRFGMKRHIGVDTGSGLVHTMEVTAASTHDMTVASKLIRKDDDVVYGDSGYLGIQKRPEGLEDHHLSAIDYRINRRPHSLPSVSDNATLGTISGVFPGRFGPLAFSFLFLLAVQRFLKSPSVNILIKR